MVLNQESVILQIDFGIGAYYYYYNIVLNVHLITFGF